MLSQILQNNNFSIFLLAWVLPSMITFLVIAGAFRRRYGVLYESKLNLFAMIFISILYPIAWIAILAIAISSEYDEGIDLIHRERVRQKIKEGWNKAHDSHYHCYELARAALCYIHHSIIQPGLSNHEPSTDSELLEGKSKWHDSSFWKDSWPWSDTWWKPAPNSIDGKIRDLTKAGALIAAQIDVLMQRRSEVEILIKGLMNDYSDKKVDDLLACDLDPLVRYHIEQWVLSLGPMKSSRIEGDADA